MLFMFAPESGKLSKQPIGTGGLKLDWGAQLLQTAHIGYVTGFIRDPRQIMRISPTQVGYICEEIASMLFPHKNHSMCGVMTSKGFYTAIVATGGS